MFVSIQGLLFLGVDTSQGMLDIFREGSELNPNVKTVCMDAVSFSQSREYSSYDRIFLKQVVHLLTHEQRLIAFEGFYKQLALKKGKLSILYGVGVNEVFPFDERTKSLFGETDVFQTLFDELSYAGFKEIQQETFTFNYPPNSIKAEDWIYLVENRLWTMFSKQNMNEQQMNDLINHIKGQYKSPNNFQAIDKETVIKCCIK